MVFVWQKVYSVSVACAKLLIFERFKLFAVRVCLAILRLGSIQGSTLLVIDNVNDTVWCIETITIIPFVS